jgi:hypothetical protein
MPGGIVKQQMPASAAEVFKLLHDYDRRLEWDTLLRKAYLTGGHERACKGATSCCVGKPCFGLIAIETEYIAFDEPKMAAVKLINKPLFFESFGASIKHLNNKHGSTAEYAFHFRARPRWLRNAIEPVMLKLLKQETAARLKALAAFMSDPLA